MPPSPFGHSPQKGEKIYFANGFFAPSGRAERKETARWAVLAKEPACRDGREATEGVFIPKTRPFERSLNKIKK